jgi:hypothetical protein
MRRLLLPSLVLVAACGNNPDERATSGESQLASKAVADVDAAMAEARRAPPIPAPVAAAEIQAEGEAAAAADGQ